MQFFKGVKKAVPGRIPLLLNILEPKQLCCTHSFIVCLLSPFSKELQALGM